MIPLAIVYLAQTVRLGDSAITLSGRTMDAGAMARNTGDTALNLWTYAFYVPIVVAMLDPASVPALSPVIGAVRQNFVATVVVMLVLGEFLLRGGTTLGVNRLAQITETTENPEELKTAIDALQFLGLYDMAIVGLRRLTTLAPQFSSKAQSHLASLLGIQRRFLLAEEAARKSISLDPANAQGHYFLAMALHELGRSKEASKHFEKAHELGLRLPRYS